MISRFGLSVLALGLSAFSAPAFAQDDPDAPDPEAVQAQANDLRQLFEAASRDGLVQLRDRPDTAVDALPQAEPRDPRAPRRYTAPSGAADCMALAPLFDGGQGGFEDGIFTELSTDGSDHDDLAETLAVLIDLSYAGEPVSVDLTSAGNCGQSFLPWQALASPSRELDAATEARLAAALNEFKPVLRRQLGVQIGIRAGITGNIRLTRRIADTLSDAGLHRTERHNADIEHVLLDAILLMDRDPVGARARLGWVADRDGPEQLIAIDLLDQLEASGLAERNLTRMTESPVPSVRDTAHQRLLATAIRDRDMAQLNALMTTDDDFSGDPESVRRLSDSLSESLRSEDPLQSIHALDLFKRLDANGVDFDDDLRSLAAARLEALSNPNGVTGEAAFQSALRPVEARGERRGTDLSGYVDQVSDDLTQYREVLSRG